MSHSIRSAFLALLVLLVPAASALAVGQGRLQGEVVDESGKPVADVAIRVTNDEIGYDNTFETNKKGKFQVLVVDATRIYTLAFSKEGFVPVTEPVKLEPGGITRKSFTLLSAGSSAGAAAAAAPAPPVEGKARAVSSYNDGVRALQAGDKESAKLAFNVARELDPDMPQPYTALAGLYLEDGDHAKAIEVSRKLLEIDAGNVVALQTLYDAYSATGDVAKAEEALEKLSALEGGGRDAAVRFYNLGAEAARIGDVEGAIGHFEKAVELDPELAPGHAALARLHIDRGDDEAALAAADRALALDPEMIDLQRVRYEAFRRTGQEEKAQEVFAALASADPEGLADALFQRGREAFDANQPEQAKQALEQALQADPEHARAHYVLGLVYVNLGDTAKAKQHLGRFIELAPDDPEAASARDMMGYLG